MRQTEEEWGKVPEDIDEAVAEILLLRAQLNQEKERADRLEKVLQSAQPPDKFLTNLWTAIHSYCAAGGGQNRSTAAMNAVVAVSRAVEEQMLGVVARSNTFEAILRQHVALTIKHLDAWAAEGNSCPPCKCVGCRTYRAALMALDMPDSGQDFPRDDDSDSE